MLVSLHQSVYLLFSANAEDMAAFSVGDMTFKVGEVLVVVSLAPRIGNAMSAAATTTLTETRLSLVAYKSHVRKTCVHPTCVTFLNSSHTP